MTADQKIHKKIYDKFKQEERQILDLDFGDTPEKNKRRLFRYVFHYQKLLLKLKGFNSLLCWSSY